MFRSPEEDESDKTPGMDGLPAKFYQVFSKDISFFLISALNYAFDSGYLSVTQRRGVIKLIPKKMRNYTSSKIGGLLLF